MDLLWQCVVSRGCSLFWEIWCVGFQSLSHKEELSDPRFRCSLRDRACALGVSTNFVLKSLPTAPDSTNSAPTFRVIPTHGNCVTRVTPLILRGVNCTAVTGILITLRRRTVPSTRDSLRLPRMSWSLLGLLATVGWPACFSPLRLPLDFLDVACLTRLVLLSLCCASGRGHAADHTDRHQKGVRITSSCPTPRARDPGLHRPPSPALSLNSSWQLVCQ